MKLINKNWSLLDEQLAESGLEMSIDPTIIFGAANVLGSIFGSASQSDAAARQEAAAKEQEERQYKYDTQKYEMNKDRLIRDREFTIEGIEIGQRNEKTLADLKDNVALDVYEQQLNERSLRIRQATKQYARSSQIYGYNKTFNDYAARTARRGEQLRFNEQLKTAAFDNQDLIIQSLQERGAVQARGQGGNSTARLASNAIGALGRNQAIIQEEILGGKRARDQGLRTVDAKKLGADIQAFSNLMMPIEDPLMPVVPRATPLSEVQLPRELEKFDFGPKPFKGVVATGGAQAAWMNGLANALPSIAGMFQNTSPPISYNNPNVSNNSSGGGFYRSNFFGDLQF